MALWTPSEGESPRFGIEGGTLFARGQGSGIMQAMPTPASKLARRQFACWTDRAVWNARWLVLEEGDRDLWIAYAEAEPFHGLTGRPRLLAAPDCFARYFANATWLAGEEPEPPWTPPAPPTWPEDNSPFEPFLDANEAMAVIIKAETTEARTFVFAGQPPTKGKGRLTRSRLMRIGKFELPASPEGFVWAEPSEAALELFGETFTNPEWQQWLVAWELSGPWPRPVLDPCYTPPTQTLADSYQLDVTADDWEPAEYTVTRVGEDFYWAAPGGVAYVQRSWSPETGYVWQAFATLTDPTALGVHGEKAGGETPEGGYSPTSDPPGSIVIS